MRRYLLARLCLWTVLAAVNPKVAKEHEKAWSLQGRDPCQVVEKAVGQEWVKEVQQLNEVVEDQRSWRDEADVGEVWKLLHCDDVSQCPKRGLPVLRKLAMYGPLLGARLSATGATRLVSTPWEVAAHVDLVCAAMIECT